MDGMSVQPGQNPAVRHAVSMIFAKKREWSDFCRDGIKIGLENKFYGKCFPAYHAAGGHFLRNGLILLAETG